MIIEHPPQTSLPLIACQQTYWILFMEQTQNDLHIFKQRGWIKDGKLWGHKSYMQAILCLIHEQEWLKFADKETFPWAINGRKVWGGYEMQRNKTFAQDATSPKPQINIVRPLPDYTESMYGIQEKTEPVYNIRSS